jgi:putative redox protein
MAVKTVHIDALESYRFVARNPRGEQVLVQAYPSPPTQTDPAGIGLGPMETLLAALGTCTAVDVQDIMRKRRTPLTRYRIELEGERAEGVPSRYTRITVRHIAGGDGVTREQLEKAAHLSHEKYCSVAASLNPDIEVRIEAVLDPEPQGTPGAAAR